MTIESLYNYPEYYELAFSFRGLDEEVAVFERVIEIYSKITVNRVLEVACGPSPHLPEIHGRGYDYVGLDNSAAMLESATRKSESASANATFVQADMKSFALPEPVDFVFVTLDSFYLSTSEEVSSHLDSVGRALRPGGLYALQWCVAFDWDVDKSGKAEWTTEVDGVKVEFSSQYGRVLDRPGQVRELRLGARVNDHGKELELESVVPVRVVFPQEFLLLLEKSGMFELVGWWNNQDLQSPIPPVGEVDWPLTVIRRI